MVLNKVGHKPFLFILVLFSFINILNIPLVKTLWRHGFDDGTYSHAFIIPFISLFLYYQLNKLGKLKFRSSPSLPLIIITALTSIVFFLSSNMQLSLGYWLSFYGLLIFSTLTIFRFSWYTLFPVAYLIFIFPIWGSFTDILQAMSVAMVSFMMSFTSIPTYVEAQYVSIPAGTFEIADGCSGLRYIIVSLAISLLYIFLYIKDKRNALIFLSVAIIGGLLTNWLRITILILIGHQTDMTHSLMYDHNSFGWYIYIPFMILLYLLGNKLTDINLLDVPTENNPSNHGQLSYKNKLNPASVIPVLVFIFISSTSLMYGLFSKPILVTNDSNLLDSPSIQFSTDIQSKPIVISGQKAIYKRYYFSGNDLDSKPTFYANDFIPNTWKEVESTYFKDWQLITIKKANQYKLVALSFQLNDFTTGNRKAFKLHRIKSLIPIQKPMLNWLLVYCKSNCKDEIKDVASTAVDHL